MISLLNEDFISNPIESLADSVQNFLFGEGTAETSEIVSKLKKLDSDQLSKVHEHITDRLQQLRPEKLTGIVNDLKDTLKTQYNMSEDGINQLAENIEKNNKNIFSKIGSGIAIAFKVSAKVLMIGWLINIIYKLINHNTGSSGKTQTLGLGYNSKTNRYE